MHLTKIVLTGGPGGGKTEAAAEMKRRFETKGFHVIVAPETATELILAGLDGRTSLDNFDFQDLQLQIQLFREDQYAKAAKLLKQDNVLFICDRGALDGCGFIEPPKFERILKRHHLTKEELYDRYDAIFQLETAAKAAQDSYTLSNNAARAENQEQAAAEDDVLYETWKDHPHYSYIPAAQTIDEKFDTLEKAIQDFLDTQNH